VASNEATALAMVAWFVAGMLVAIVLRWLEDRW